MGVNYICSECKKNNKPWNICEYCFAPVEKIYDTIEKKENPMNKQEAIKFIKSQQYITQKFSKDKKIQDKYKNLLDLIQKAIPDEGQESLFN